MTAPKVHRPTRADACREMGVELVCVSSMTTSGFAHLYNHIGASCVCMCCREKLIVRSAGTVDHPDETRAIIGTMKLALYRLGTWALDQLAELLSLPTPKNVNQPVRNYTLTSNTGH